MTTTDEDELYMNWARRYAEQSKCGGQKVGAVIADVERGVILAHGYIGIPDGLGKFSHPEPCFKITNDWLSEKAVSSESNGCLALHAGPYTIINAANRDDENKISLKGATLFTTHQPCRDCALHIVAAHITKVVYEHEYPDAKGIEFLQLANVQVEKYTPTIENEEYMNMARRNAEKSTCGRRKVGAVIVNVKRRIILAHGYNGVPDELIKCSHQEPCFKIANNWPSGKQVPSESSNCLALHAEQYAIINAANREEKGKISLKGATLYTTHQPCRDCALHIVAAHITKVVYEHEYPDAKGIEFLRLANVQVERYTPIETTPIEISSLINSNNEVNIYV